MNREVIKNNCDLRKANEISTPVTPIGLENKPKLWHKNHSPNTNRKVNNRRKNNIRLQQQTVKISAVNLE